MLDDKNIQKDIPCLGEYKFIITSRVVNNFFVVVTIDGDKNSCTIVVDIHFDVAKIAYLEIFYTFEMQVSSNEVCI